MLEIKVEQFEGPLDLLLRLIETEKLAINEVSLAKVTDQYLGAIQSLAQESRLDELADFLLIAAKLILIKSKTLLPSLSEDDEEEIVDLQSRLKMYQEFVHAAEKLGEWYTSSCRSFARPMMVQEQRQFLPSKKVSPDFLATTFGQVVARLAPPPPKVSIPIDLRITVQEKIASLRKILSSSKAVSFWNFCEDKGSKSEAIASFLAALELVKQRQLMIDQSELFSEITLRGVPSRVA